MPFASTACTTGTVVKLALCPFWIVVGTGWVEKTSRVATTSGLIDADVALTRLPDAAVSTKLASPSLAEVYFTPLKVAIPFEAVT